MAEIRGMDWSQATSNRIPQGKNHLLAIGIDAYKHCPRLKNAVRDAEDVVNILCGEYLFEREHTVLIKNEEATEENILSSFEDLVKRVGPEDSAFIFFSGHGTYNDHLKMGAWVPVDARPDNRGDFIDNSVILNLIKVINAKHTFLVADSCFSGTLFEGTRDTGKEKDLKHLKKMVRKNSRWGLTSGGNELVSDGHTGTNSPFTENLLRFLRTSSDKPFSVSKLVYTVSKETEKITQQTPDSGRIPHSGDQRGEMVFIPRALRDSFYEGEEIIERQGQTQSRVVASNRALSASSSRNKPFVKRYRKPLLTMAAVAVISGILGIISLKYGAFVFGTGAILLTAFELFSVRGRVALFFKLATVAVITADIFVYYVWKDCMEIDCVHWVAIAGLGTLTTLFIVWASLEPDDETE